jgi:hypothetical protein
VSRVVGGLWAFGGRGNLISTRVLGIGVPNIELGFRILEYEAN